MSDNVCVNHQRFYREIKKYLYAFYHKLFIQKCQFLTFYFFHDSKHFLYLYNDCCCNIYRRRHRRCRIRIQMKIVQESHFHHCLENCLLSKMCVCVFVCVKRKKFTLIQPLYLVRKFHCRYQETFSFWFFFHSG